MIRLLCLLVLFASTTQAAPPKPVFGPGRMTEEEFTKYETELRSLVNSLKLRMRKIK